MVFSHLSLLPLNQQDTDKHAPLYRVRLFDRCLALFVSLLSVACFALHLVFALEASTFINMAMLGLAFACLGCALHGLRHGGVAMWTWMVVGALAMLSVHLFAHGEGHSHAQLSAQEGAAPELSSTVSVAMGLTALELVLGLIALAFAGVAMRRNV